MKISKSYPNYDNYIPNKKPYDLNKWISAMKDIYIKTHMGMDRSASINQIINDWPRDEKLDFINWMKFYESGGHLKYKTAQKHSYYINDDIPGYFMPNPSNIPSPIKNINEEISNIPTSKTLSKENTEDRKRDIIENHRRKLIGRLNSLEKLLGSNDGHLFAGNEFENLLKSIYELKRQIQTLNKISLSTQTYKDIIIRQSNILLKNGYEKPSILLKKFAQNVPGQNNPAPPTKSRIDSGEKDGLTNPIPSTIGQDPPDLKDKDPIDKLLENINTMGLTDENNSDDVEIEDVIKSDLVSEAQSIPSKQPLPIKPEQKIQEKPKQDVKEKPIIQQDQETDYEKVLDNAFANITIQDVIDELESVSNIFKQRQIPRKLSIIDLMLNKLNLSSFFTNLGEIIEKSHGSNQYVLTRLEDITSKLRGAIETTGFEESEKKPVSQEIENIAKKLQDQKEKEKLRKEFRKKQEEKEILESEKPEIEIENIPQEIVKEPAKIQSPIPTAKKE